MRVKDAHMSIMLFVLFSVCPSVFAIKSYEPEISNPFLEDWRWKHYDELDGKGVKSISEGISEDVWFATNQGIYRYDGYVFHLFDTADGLSGLPVYQIKKTYDDKLYASTQDGLFILKKNTWSNVFTDPTHSFNILTIREIEGEGLFCLTGNGFVRISKSNEIQVFTSKELIEQISENYSSDIQWIVLPDFLFQHEDHLFTDITRDEKGFFWLCSNADDEGIILKFRHFNLNGVFPSNYKVLTSDDQYKYGSSQKILKAENESLWIVSSNFRIGIHVFNKTNHEYIQLSELFGGDEYHWNIIQNTNGDIFISGLGQFFVFNHENWNHYNSENVPIPPSCRVIVCSTSEKNLWIGGLQNKIYKFDYTDDNWLTYNNLNFQCESSDGKQWFLEAKGRIVVKNDENWISYGTEDGLMDFPVRLICTSKDQLWAAGTHDGVAATAFFQNNSWTLQKHPELSWGIDYRSVFEAMDGSLWFGAAVDFQKEKGQRSGLLQLKNPLDKNEQWYHYYIPAHGSMSYNTYGIAQSRDGRIWKGGLGLSYFNGEKWFKVESPNELTDYVNIVYSRPEIELYAGSRYYGLFVFDGDKWQVYNSNSGLSSNTVISIFAESDNSIWLATDNDISYFDGQQWFVNLFPSEMTMKMEGGAVFKDKSNQLWINISPREWKRRAFEYSKTNPSVYEKFKVYRYKPYEGSPETYLKNHPEKISSSDQVTFLWEGKDFFKTSENSRLKYSFRLNNEDWSEFTNQTNKTYFNLPAGDYDFEVRAIDLDMNIDNTPARAKFEVVPPIWKQAWFIILISGMTSVIVFSIFQIFKRDRKLVLANNELNNANRILNKQKEEISYQKEQLNKILIKNEQLSLTKLNFYTNISHEFRTPLTLILANIENLYYRNLNFDKRKMIYDKVQHNAHRLLNLINQILEFRKIESGTLKLITRKGDLIRFIEKLTQLFIPLAEKKKIALKVKKENIKKCIAFFDPDKIEKIIYNLLSNAFKFTPEGGTIEIKMRISEHTDVTVLNQPVNEFLKICVCDNGVGISKESLKKIFERYFSDHLKNEQHTDNSGIGLSFVKDLIEVHGGSITVDSTVGKGTLFEVSIPILDKPTKETKVLPNDEILEYHFSENIHHAVDEMTKVYSRNLDDPVLSDNPSAEIMNDNNNSPKVLIVEDNADMRELLRNNLKHKYKLYECNDGEQALNLTSELNFDLILSDIMMPNMDGLALCKKIKSNINTSHIPVILLTAKSFETHQIEGFETGADDYIIKPFNKKILPVRIDNILENRRLLREKFSKDFSFEPKEVKLPSGDKQFLTRLVELMEKNISDANFNVEKMSVSMGISHAHFIMKVKNLTGQKPHDLLKTYRLKRARQLLRQKEISISEIAYSVGYDNPSSFTRAFKAKYEQSPTAYMETSDSSDQTIPNEN